MCQFEVKSLTDPSILELFYCAFEQDSSCSIATRVRQLLALPRDGVATVWLVATLGSKSNLRKVNRKAILEVNVPKTCEVIINPEAPMALRLQSNLLYGVSRVYLQQCGYTLSDAQNVQMNMMTLSKLLRTASLDPNAGKARPDQLLLEDDPAFVPEMVLPGLDIDLAALDISTEVSSRRSSLLSPPSQRTSLSSQWASDESALSLVIPSSEGGGAGELGGFIVPSSEHASVQHIAGAGDLFAEEDDFNLDPGFMFDNDGNMINTGDDVPPTQTEQMLPAASRTRSDSGASAHVRRELEEGLQAGQFELGDLMDLDIGIPRADDEDLIFPQAEAFPPTTAQALAGTAPLDESASEAAIAPQQRRSRQPKELPVDRTQELRNADLAQWNNEYLANMDEAKKSKHQHKSTAVARQNAAFWVFGAGIGGTGAGMGASQMKGPLAEMFAGDALMRLLTGAPASVAGSKRSRSEDEGDGTDSETRRVRIREDEKELGRAQGLMLDDDDTMVLPGSEAIEMGRHGQASLDDTSQFPWNRSASLRGSRQGSIAQSHGFASSIGGIATSVGRPSSLPPITGPGSMDRRASRITAASPLVGRGADRSELDMPHFDEIDLLGGPSTSIAGDDFQYYGPAAGVDTQTAAQSQWLRAALDTESNNFLHFVKAEIANKVAVAQEGEDELSGGIAAPDSVFFEELLPPARNSKIVAAQALLHVLALATKSLVKVDQHEHYGPINLGPVADV
ncbi:MAG: hypothetical protein Q9216_003494 [Gyalolechia sp. 2 TL-2023]